jgi:hypothetical protein
MARGRWLGVRRRGWGSFLLSLMLSSGEPARRAVRTSAATAGDGERRRSPSTFTDPPLLASSHVSLSVPL